MLLKHVWPQVGRLVIAVVEDAEVVFVAEVEVVVPPVAVASALAQYLPWYAITALASAAPQTAFEQSRMP